MQPEVFQDVRRGRRRRSFASVCFVEMHERAGGGGGGVIRRSLSFAVQFAGNETTRVQGTSHRISTARIRFALLKRMRNE